jgi:hypothetical protein
MTRDRLAVGIALALLLGGSPLPLVHAAPPATPEPPANNTTSSAADVLANGSGTANNSTAPNGSSTSLWNGTGNASNPCAGMGTVEGAVCTGIRNGIGSLVAGVVEYIADGILSALRNAAETFIEVLVSRPVPLRNGEVELVQRPTNPPMGAVYDLWLVIGLPAAIAVWALMMLLMRLTVFLPSQAVSVAQSRAKRLEGWFALFRILSSWIWCALVLHLTLGIAVWFAPSGDQIFTSFESLAETAVSGGIAALIVYLSSGILFVLVLLVFGLSFLAPFVLLPAYPLFIAISIPDFWIFEWFAQKGESLRSLFAPAAFMPVPTAIILGAGYPVLNAIRGSLSGPIASIAGVPTYIILLLVMWAAALVSPLFLFLGTRKMRPLSMFAAGALGAATAGNVSRGAGGLRGRLERPILGGSSSSDSIRNGGVGRAVDPVNGSPFSRDKDGGFGGAVESSGRTSLADALESGGPSDPDPAGPPTTVVSERSHKDRSDTTGSRSGEGSPSQGSSPGWEQVTSRSIERYADSVPNEVGFNEATTRTQLNRERYDAGYFDNRGEFKTLSQGPSNTGWLLDEGAFKRIAAGEPNKPVLLYDEENEVAHDARSVATDGEYRKDRYERERLDSRRMVRETRLQ